MSDTTTLAVKAPADLAKERLTTEELVEYDRYARSGKPDLSLSTSLKLYELWVQGSNCQDLAKLNPHLGLGCILKARVDHRWDERRDAYLAELYLGANDRLRQIGVEALNFMGLALAATHKEQGERMKKYLQTGNPEDLGVMRIQSWQTYKSIIETIVKLTGQDKPKAPGAPSALPSERYVSEAEGRAQGIQPGGGRWTPETADKMRALLRGKKNE